MVDKICNEIEIGDKVVFASKDSHNRPYLCEGVITEFIHFPIDEVFILTEHKRKVKKTSSQLVKIG